MKNINTKKVIAGAAALAVGASFLGAAVAAQVDFGSPVVKGDVIGTSGMPTATVIVGTAAQPADVIWAGNIAAAIASKAYTEETHTIEIEGTPATEGTTTVSGDGKLFDKYAIGTSTPNTIDYRDYSLLGDYKVKVNTTITSNGTDEVKIKDKIGLTTTIAFDNDEDVADLTASIYKRGIDYNVEFTPSIAKDANDSGSRDLKFKIMGKEYTMEKWNGTTLTLVQNKATTPYSEGDSFTVGDYTVVVNNILDTGIDNEAYEVELQLKDAAGTVVATDVYQAEDEIFEEFFDISVEIAKVYSTRITIISGTSVKLELSDGLIEDFPEKDDELWHVKLHKVGNDLSKIQIFNNENETQWKDEDALKAGDEVALPYDFAKFQFVGLTTEDTKEVTVEDGYIEYTDADDDDHKVFFYEEDTLTINDGDAYTTSQSIDDHKLYFKFYTTDVPDANTNIVYSGDNATGQEGYFTVQLDNKDGDYLTAGAVDGTGTWSWGSNTVTDLAKFAYGTDGTNVTVFTDIKIPLYNNESEILTYGVFIAENAGTNVISQIGVALKGSDNGTPVDQGTIESNTQKWSIGKTYTQIQTDGSTDSDYVGSTSATDAAITTRDMRSMFEFIVTDTTGSTITAHIDAYTGDLVNTDDTAYSAAKEQVLGTNANLDQEDTDDLTWAYTNFGTKYEVDGGKFMATVPDTALKGKIFIGNGTVTTEGTEGTAGSTQTYTTYTPANIDAMNLVKMDTASVAGTKIVVGGHIVNTLAQGVTNDYLAQAGQWVMGKDTAGNIIVAGFTADDTGAATRAFIQAIQ